MYVRMMLSYVVCPPSAKGRFLTELLDLLTEEMVDSANNGSLHRSANLSQFYLFLSMLHIRQVKWAVFKPRATKRLLQICEQLLKKKSELTTETTSCAGGRHNMPPPPAS